MLYDPTQQEAREYLWSRLKAGYCETPGVACTRRPPRFIASCVRRCPRDQDILARCKRARDFNVQRAARRRLLQRVCGHRSDGWHAVSVLAHALNFRWAEGRRGERGGHADAQRVGRDAAVWRCAVERRHTIQVELAASVDRCRPEYADEWHSVVDHGEKPRPQYPVAGLTADAQDIGGYAGGNPASADFRELVVRWFQFGVTCPLFRQHGARDTGPWLLGNASLAAVNATIALRQALRGYVLQSTAAASATGLPINRPLWWDFPSDPEAWGCTSAYMFGPDYLASPVTAPGAQNWTVYLPRGATYTHYFTGRSFTGGVNITVATPLETFPLFKVART